MGEVIGHSYWAARLDIDRVGMRIRGPADPFVDAIARTTDRNDRLMLATRALRRDPDCIEANLIVAAACEDVDRKLIYLNIAVEAGTLHWEAEDMKELLDRAYGAVPGARPWLVAIRALGDAFVEAGEPDDARDCYERLLALDISDAVGARGAMDGLMAPALAR